MQTMHVDLIGGREAVQIQTENQFNAQHLSLCCPVNGTSPDVYSLVHPALGGVALKYVPQIHINVKFYISFLLKNNMFEHNPNDQHFDW